MAKKTGASGPADDDSILDDETEREDEQGPEDGDAELLDGDDDAQELDDVDGGGDDDGEGDDAEGEAEAEAEGDEETEDRGDEPEAEGHTGDDDLTDDPKALKEIVRTQRRVLAAIGSEGRRTPTTTDDDSDSKAKNARIQKAFEELSKDPNSPSAIVLAELTARQLQLEEDRERERQERQRERSVDNDLDRMRVSPKLRPIVRRLSLEKGLEPGLANLVVIGALTLRARTAKKTDAASGGKPILKRPADAGARRPAGSGPKTSTMKPVRRSDASAGGSSSGPTVTHNGFKMKPVYTEDQYSAMLERLEKKNPAAARALFDARVSGKVRIGRKPS